VTSLVHLLRCHRCAGFNGEEILGNSEHLLISTPSVTSAEIGCIVRKLYSRLKLQSANRYRHSTRTHDLEGISRGDLLCCLNIAHLGHPPSPDPRRFHFMAQVNGPSCLTILDTESETARDGCCSNRSRRVQQFLEWMQTVRIGFRWVHSSGY
jgi:hypothetical protein